jgi:hypothetical protein
MPQSAKSNKTSAQAPMPEGVGAVVSSYRPCHALERLFVDLNIRFAVGLAFESPVSAELARLALVAGLRVSGLDRLAVVMEGSTTSIAVSRHSITKIEPVPIVDESLTVTLEGLVARSHVPSLGTVQCYLITTTGSADNDGATTDEVVVGVVVNANHALCDGRLLQTCMGAVADAISGKEPHRQPPPFHDPTVLRSLHDDLKLWSDENPPPDPIYLPPPQDAAKVVRLSEIPYFLDSSRDDSTKNFTLRRDIPGSVVARCHHELHLKQATITGLMAACWIQAIHEAILANDGLPEGDGTPVVTISCLVALHSQLPKGLYTNAFGTVTLAGEGVLHKEDNQSQQSFVDRMIDLAAECTRDLRSRIHRGEAANQSLALCRGEFDSSGSTPGTIELSNHGVYRTSDAISEVAMQQGFDGYDGVSVSMVSESHSQVMRLLANVGPMYRRRAIESVIDRVVELWRLVSDSEC